MESKKDLAPVQHVVEQPNKVQGENVEKEKQEEEEWERPETALECYRMALERKKFTDVVFTFEKSKDQVEAHQAILQLQSPEFRAQFKGQGSSADGKTMIEVKGCNPQRFREFLEFLYTDKFEVNIVGALDLLQLAERYNVRPLIKKCEGMLKTEIKVDDAIEIFEAARKYGTIDLEKKAGNVMANSLAEISQKESFLDVQEEILVYLLGRDELTLEEIDLFKLVVKWGEKKLKMNPELDESLKNVLANMIPLVRFPIMSPSDFYTHVAAPGNQNLLDDADIRAIYDYYASCAMKNKAASSSNLRFSTRLRNTGKMEGYVNFYDEVNECSLTKEGEHPVKECISFRVEYSENLPIGSGIWNGFSFKRPAIKKIFIHCPTRHIVGTCLEGRDALEFTVSIKWAIGIISEHTVRTKFEKSLTMAGKEMEVVVKPPVELIDGITYCITLEDNSRHFAHKRKDRKTGESSSVKYDYVQEDVGPGVLMPELGVNMKGWPMKLTNIERDVRRDAFFPNNYENLRLIKGLYIVLM